MEFNLHEESEDDEFFWEWKLLETLYKDLGIEEVINKYSVNYNFNFDLDKIMKLLVFQRILNSTSKTKMLKSQSNLLGVWDINKNDLFRGVDHLYKIKDEV